MELFLTVLPLMLTVAAVAVLKIPKKAPKVAVEYVQFSTVLLRMFTVLDAAVEPIALLIPISKSVVAPLFRVTLLKLMVTLALVPAWA
jgi:hypothetical protein